MKDTRKLKLRLRYHSYYSHSHSAHFNAAAHMLISFLFSVQVYSLFRIRKNDFKTSLKIVKAPTFLND